MESKAQRKWTNLHKRCHNVDKKTSCTTWDVGNPVNNEINYLSAGTGFLPCMSSISECKVNAKLSMKNLLQDTLWTRWKTLQTVHSIELFWNRNRSIEIPTSPRWQCELNIGEYFATVTCLSILCLRKDEPKETLQDPETEVGSGLRALGYTGMARGLRHPICHVRIFMKYAFEAWLSAESA